MTLAVPDKPKLRGTSHLYGFYVALVGAAVFGISAAGMLGDGGSHSTLLLVVLWVAAAAGIAIEWLPVRAPRGYVTTVFLTMGWMGLVAFPGIYQTLGATAFWLIFGGGLLYSVGALVHAWKWPDPAPSVLGYHEIWHVCVLAALCLHYIAIAGYVLPGD